MCLKKIILIFLIAPLIACQTPLIRTISQKQLEDRYSNYLGVYKSELDAISSQSIKRIEAEYRGAQESLGSDSQSYDVLILSGGGAFGAFGIGFLEGWGKLPESELARPEFDSVSGVSTGALIAPFAFIGTPDAYKEIIGLYENPKSDWVRKRGFIPYLPGNVSLYDVKNLNSKIRSTVTAKLIQGIAEGSKEGRQLLVGATNIDYGIMRVWDLARIANSASIKDAQEISTSLLLASAAIPGAFPPILIDDYLYVDGGASMQIVSGIDERRWAYSRKSQSFHFVKENKPIKIRIWIIVNQKLLSDPSVVRSRWTSIAQRSLSTLIRTSTLQALQDIETYTRLMDLFPEIDAEMRYVAIPQSFPIPDSDDMFDKEAMRRLLKLGRDMGANSSSWKSETLRPGAPF